MVRVSAYSESGSAPHPQGVRRPQGERAVGRPHFARKAHVVIGAAAFAAAVIGCDEPGSPVTSTPQATAPTAAVRIVFEGATTRRTDLPSSAQGCLDGVGATHIHPSWRAFAGIPLTPHPPNRYEITFSDVPVATRVTFRVNDQNACDENPTGAVTRNIFVNDVRLVHNATTPGNGDEPGFAFSVASNGTVAQ